MWVAVIVFCGGVGYRIVEFFKLTKKKPREFCPTGGIREDSPEERKLRPVIFLQNSLLGQHPVMAVVSLIFHLLLFAVPVLTLAHNLLLYETTRRLTSWGFCFFSLPDGLIDVMTVIVLAGAFFFLMRRLVLPRVRAISMPSDYLVLAITAAPFLTGFIAYHQWFNYHTIVTLHVLCGELMLVAIPFTKLGHMVFFFFVRICFGSEFSLGRGSRTWST